jgi:hypothetical protein
MRQQSQHIPVRSKLRPQYLRTTAFLNPSTSYGFDHGPPSIAGLDNFEQEQISITIWQTCERCNGDWAP